MPVPDSKRDPYVSLAQSINPPTTRQPQLSRRRRCYCADDRARLACIETVQTQDMEDISFRSEPSPPLPSETTESPPPSEAGGYSTPTRPAPPTSLSQTSPPSRQTPTRTPPTSSRDFSGTPTLSPFRHGRLVTRPLAGPRKPSSTMIVRADSTIPVEEPHDPARVFPPDDARAMSPRRNSVETDRLAEGVRHQMESRARELQTGLSDMVDRIEAVRMECERLEGGNRFLQSYIGELMQTSRVTQTAGGRKKR